jgi:hypothetical protein
MKVVQKDPKKKKKILDPNKPCVWKRIKEIRLHTIQGNSINFVGDKCYIFGGQQKMKFSNRMYTINW